jgi:ABC-type hemin transport system substrate-binding protein
LEDAIDVLEKNKINGLVGEPDVIIVMRHNGNHTGGDKLIDAVIYIGALPSEVAADLNLLTV